MAAAAKSVNIDEYASSPLDYAFQEIKNWEELLEHTPVGNQYTRPGSPRPLLPGEEKKKQDDDTDKKKDEPYWAKKSPYGFSSYSTPPPATASSSAAAPTTAGAGRAAQPITIITAQQLAAQQSSGPATVHMPCVSVLRVNNNELSHYVDFLPTLNLLLWQPTINLNWLDLSHNKLTSIDPAICELKALSVLYIHGNNITEFSELIKLNTLTSLTKLAAHGNELISVDPQTKKKSVARLEDTPFYRSRLIFTLQSTSLKMLDFSAITPRDRQLAVVWSQNHSKRTAKRSPSPKRTINGPGAGVGAAKAAAKK